MQNLVIFMEPSKNASNISLQGGNMWLNRFLIDEDAAFELSGVHYFSLKTPSLTQGKSKGKENFGLEETIFDINTDGIIN